MAIVLLYSFCIHVCYHSHIDNDELKMTMNGVGIPVTDTDIAVMLKEVGVAIHGRIYYEGNALLVMVLCTCFQIFH